MGNRSDRLLRLLASSGVVLLLGLGTRLIWLGSIDERAAERYALGLGRLHLLDAELSAETLKARSGLVSHYDNLVHTERELSALYRSLHDVPAFVRDTERARLLGELARADASSRESFLLVERFKSENAVLRNSLLYLRTQASVLDAYPGTTHDERSFREDASALVRDVLLLRLSQDQSVLERVSRSLVALEHYVDGLPPAQREQLGTVLSHARAVREHAPSVDSLVRQIVDQPAFVHRERLIASYARMQRDALSRASQSTTVLLAMLWLLGSLVAFTVIVRMRRSARALLHTHDQLQAALDALKVEQTRQRELAELKTRFVAMTSHEFRTPLSTIMSSSELLDAYDARWSRDKKAQHFQRIRGAVQHMTRMLDAILMIGRSDAGKLEFKPARVQLASFCSEVVETAEKALTSAHELCVDAPCDPAVVLADETLLRHIVDNLLSNAIKYSPRGGRVDFRVRCEGDDLVLEVRDHGIGIPARDREQLFELFHRGANVGSVAGSGLGLSIVKRALDLHGGSVHVESELMVGTRFVVRVRCAASATSVSQGSAA